MPPHSTCPSAFFRDKGNDTKSKIAATYDYTSEQGELLFQVVRFTPKGFRQRRPDGHGGWLWRLDDTPRVLYRLPRVRQAIQDGTDIVVVEGERDVESIERAEPGVVATCNPMGAGKWRDEYAVSMCGAARVIVVADRDEKGRAHAREVAENLDVLVGEVVLAEPAAGNDTSDHLTAGYSLEQLVRVEYEPDRDVPVEDEPDRDEHRVQDDHHHELTPTLPSSFYAARPELEHIRRAAHSRMCSADAVLHTVLARVAADIDHAISLPAIVRVRSPLCYYAALIGPPGAGKTAAGGVAAEILAVNDATLDGLPIGSGEGLIDILFETVTEAGTDAKPTKVKKQTRHNAYWYIDEGQLLSDLASRSGTTILSALRSAWSGAVLGNTNADPERRRKVPAGSYTFGVTIGFQPTKAAQLLADGAGGTPQRFTWASATDPRLPDEPPPWPGPLQWRCPPGPTGQEIRQDFEVNAAVAREIRAANLARTRGHETPDELDAHRLLLRLRVAALLSLLNNPTLAVTAEDWRLAGIVMDTSDAVRTGVLAELRDAERERENATSERLARRAVVVQERTRDWHTVEAARAIWHKVPATGTTNVSEVRRRCSRTQRDLFDDALTHATAERWLIEHSEPGQGDAKRVLERGPERPG